jgi:conjugative relaxase-like TrwC/TraI family protein
MGRSSWRYYLCDVVGGAHEYYSERGDAPGHWYGSGLAHLGLTSGVVVAGAQLEALFARAISPTTGEQLGAGWRDGSVTGYDLTFSAPKSVSALWALGDEQTADAVVAAHAGAVRAGLDYLQTHAGYSRRGRNGIEQISTAGYAAALFDHGTSRTGDPQLHTHALVVNKVRCTDGGWRTLDGFEVYHHKKSAGAVYQAALRAELTARLPVRFGPVSEHGQAEIAGVPEELLSVWSTRTTAVHADAAPTIAQAETALGRPVTATERARIIKTAVLATRPAKPAHVPQADLRRRWVQQAGELGWDRGTLAVAVARGPVAAASVGQGWQQQVIVEAVTAVGRLKAIWSRADLAVQVAARIPTDSSLMGGAATAAALVADLTDHAIGIAPREPGPDPDQSIATVEPAVVPAGGVVALGADRAGGTARASDARYASAELVAMEARIIERVISGGYRHPERLHPAITDHLADPRLGLSREQAHAVVNLLASRDLLTVMVAPAGAGKTRTLGAAAGIWTSQRRTVIALGPSARAAAELAAVTGTGGRTVASWLGEQDHQYAREQHGEQRDGGWRPWLLSDGPVIVIDEASMLSTADLDRVTAHAGRLHGRVVLVGDPAQIGAVNAPGGMLEHLANRLGPRVIELSELHRFTHDWEAAASLRLRAGDPSVIATYLDHGRVHPEPSAADAADAVIARWQGAAEAGADVVMLARSWTDVTALNARALAVATGAVSGPDLLTVATRSASNRGQVQDRSWRAGDVLITKRNTAEISIGGERVRNGDRFQVLTASTDQDGNVRGLVVADLAGRGTTTLPTQYLARHVEYGWACTIDGAQGATADIAVLLARSGLDREHLYVAMTRGRIENHVHTTPELLTGDAGPHQLQPTGVASVVTRGRTRARQVPGQLALPEYDTAVEQLTRAVTTTGAERAAHSLLEPHIQAAREHSWARDWDREHQAPAPGQPAGLDYPEHRQHADQLQGAHTAEKRARVNAQTMSEHVNDLTTRLQLAPFFARSRRRDLTGQITAGQQELSRAVSAWQAAIGQVQHLRDLVEADRVERDSETAPARELAHTAWATRSHTPYLDADTLTYPIGTWTNRDRRPELIHHDQWHDAAAPTHEGPTHVMDR